MGTFVRFHLHIGRARRAAAIATLYQPNGIGNSDSVPKVHFIRLSASNTLLDEPDRSALKKVITEKFRVDAIGPVTEYLGRMWMLGLFKSSSRRSPVSRTVRISDRELKGKRSFFDRHRQKNRLPRPDFRIFQRYDSPIAISHSSSFDLVLFPRSISPHGCYEDRILLGMNITLHHENS
jgi:hypothetical protein